MHAQLTRKASRARSRLVAAIIALSACIAGFGTDASAFASTGIPTVVFGPGYIDQAHTADEWIAVDQLVAATEILYEFLSSL